MSVNGGRGNLAVEQHFRERRRSGLPKFKFLNRERRFESSRGRKDAGSGLSREAVSLKAHGSRNCGLNLESVAGRRRLASKGAGPAPDMRSADLSVSTRTSALAVSWPSDT